jgi:hypothetical protein
MYLIYDSVVRRALVGGMLGMWVLLLVVGIGTPTDLHSVQAASSTPESQQVVQSADESGDEESVPDGDGAGAQDTDTNTDAGDTPPTQTEDSATDTVSGQDGERGTSSDETVVDTGDAQSSADIQNEHNTNEATLDTAAATSGPAASDESATTTDESGATTTDDTPGDGQQDELSGASDGMQMDDDSSENGTGTPEQIATGTDRTATTTATTTISNTNVASSTNRVIVDSTTGTNTASSSGDAVVRTGDSVASANIVNVVNSNIFNSHGAIMLMNWLMGSRSLDLRDIDFGGSTFAGAGEQQGGTSAARCSLSSCEDTNVTYNVTSSSTASITNDVVVRSQTGRNRVHASGSAAVRTGDAYSSANVVNVANSNFVNSNYLLLSLNNFGNFTGDVVFPGSQFFSRFLSRGVSGGTTTVSNENRADITNNVSVSADTGNNTASSTNGTSTVSTGAGTADSSVSNQINTNKFGGEEVYILFKVHGNWSGNIFGLPDGISWERTPQGIKIYSTDAGRAAGTATTSATGTDPMSRLTVSNKNKATISNDVGVYALTGENEVSGESGASVETGNARAAANVVNMANTNVVGRNWMFAIFNIFGNFQGDIAFGRPDLWVGMRANSPDADLKPGSPLTYTYTIANRGDSPATDVTLAANYNTNRMRFTDSAGGGRNGSRSWDIGRLDPGETRELTRTARIENGLPYGDTPIQTRATVSANEPDENEADNSDELSMLVRRGTPSDRARGDDDGDDGIHGSPTDSTSRADLSVEKEANYAFTKASSTVQYTIEVENHGGYAYNSILIDTLRNEAGEIINQQRWSLGEILPDEEIEVTYSLFFNGSTTPGTYTNSAVVRANDQYRDPNLGFNADSNVAEAAVDIVERLPGEAVPEAERETPDSDDEGVERSGPANIEETSNEQTDDATPAAGDTAAAEDEQSRPIVDTQQARAPESNEQFMTDSGGMFNRAAGSRAAAASLSGYTPFGSALFTADDSSLASITNTQTTTPLGPEERDLLASAFVAELTYRQWSIMVLLLALLLVLLMLYRRVEHDRFERE